MPSRKRGPPKVQSGELNTRAPYDTFKHDGYDDAKIVHDLGVYMIFSRVVPAYGKE